MQLWQRVWREGLAPLLSERGLQALRRALVRDDPNLVQGRTMTPPPLAGLEDAEVETACALCYTAWHGDGCNTVGALEAFFEQTCSAADLALGEPAACRHFLDWFDATPRPAMRRQLLNEVEVALEQHSSPLAA
jgi:hypothetical protein